MRNTTIALPKYRSDLLAAISGRYVATKIARFDRAGLADPVDGTVFCFVEWRGPGPSGPEVCQVLRRSSHHGKVYITAVLDDDSLDVRLQAVHAGADDHITGPLTSHALCERMESFGLRRADSEQDDTLKIGDYLVSLSAHQLHWKGDLLPLRPGEFALMVALLNRRNRLLSLEEIIAISGVAPGSIQKRTVHVWMGRLRRVLGEHGIDGHIRSVRSLGYVFDYTDPA